MKRGQLKIQQMAFMIIAVFVFFVLAGMFFLVLQTRSLSQDVTRQNEEQAALIAEVIANYPEFSCEEDTSYCVSTDKIMVLNATRYKNLFPVSAIKFIVLYSSPKITDEVVCNMSNYPNCNVFKVMDKKQADTSSVGTYVSLCRWENNGYPQRVCNLGRISIEYQVKS